MANIFVYFFFTFVKNRNMTLKKLWIVLKWNAMLLRRGQSNDFINKQYFLEYGLIERSHVKPTTTKPEKWSQSLSILVEFAFGEIHFRMLFHEFLQNILFLLFLASWKTKLLLPLIIHHFLY